MAAWPKRYRVLTSRELTDALVIPRKLPGRTIRWRWRNSAAYSRHENSTPCATEVLPTHLQAAPTPDALIFPTVPRVAMDATPPDASSVLPNFMTTIQNTDPGSNAGLPGLQMPMALGGKANCRSAWNWMARRQ